MGEMYWERLGQVCKSLFWFFFCIQSLQPATLNRVGVQKTHGYDPARGKREEEQEQQGEEEEEEEV